MGVFFTFQLLSYLQTGSKLGDSINSSHYSLFNHFTFNKTFQILGNDNSILRIDFSLFLYLQLYFQKVEEEISLTTNDTI